jgi:hypothetical protein
VTVARPSYFPQVAISPLGNYAQPASGVRLNGWGIGAIYSSANANWLHKSWSDWVRYHDERALTGPDALDATVVQRVSSSALNYTTGAGLGPLTPITGGVYIVGGVRVDMTDAPTVFAGVLGQTFAPSTTNYVHIKPMPDLSGSVASSTCGEILVSTNATEAGYGRVLDVVTDGSDVLTAIESANVVEGYVWGITQTFDTVNAGTLFFDRASGLGAAGSTTLSLVPGSATDQCLVATGATSVNVIEGVCSSTGAAIKGRNSSSGDAGYFQQTGSGLGLRITTAAGSGVALDITGNSSADAVDIAAGAGRVALDAQGGSGASIPAVRGTGGSATAWGGHFRTSTGASAGGVGLVGEGRGTATVGLHGLSDNGYGLVMESDSSSPTYPAGRIVPQDADPSSGTLDGSLIWRSGTGMKQIRHCVAGSSYRSLLSFGPGSALYIATVSNAVTSDNVGTSYVSVLTLQARDADGNGFYGASAGYYVLIEVEMDVRANTAATAILDVKLTDETNGGATILERTAGTTALGAGYHLLVASTSWQRTVCLSTMYSPANDGDFTVGVNIRKGGGGAANGIHVRDVKCRIVGTFP